MKSSFRLFSIGGIEVKLHLTLLILFLLPVLEITSGGLVGAAYTFAFFLALFASVLIHELSHSFVAIRNGMRVRQIILWPLGGIANIGMIKEPVKELKVSLAGPLTSLALGLSLALVVVSAAGVDGFLGGVFSGEAFEIPSLFNFTVLVAYLNLVLGTFNLFLPIFPMDGGRVLRSLLAMVTDRMRATRLAVRIGQGFLAVFVFFAVMAGNLWLILISVFLFVAGLSELKATELDERIGKSDIGKAVRRNFLAVSPDMRVEDLERVASPNQNLYPVLDKKGKPLGLVMLDDAKGKTGRVRDVMGTDFPAIKLGGEREEALQVYSSGYAFVLDKAGALYGILTLKNLQKVLQPAQ